MEEIANYQINGKDYTQTFLTIEQTIQFTKLIKGLSLDVKNIPVMIETLVKSGKLQGMLEIVLDGPKPINVKAIKPALLLKIIGDFFSFNELLDIISTISDLMGVVNDSGVLPELSSKMQAIANQTGTN